MKKYLTIISVLILGICARLYLISTRDVFTDEVFYYAVAQQNSLRDFILISHWIKDHGNLIYFVLKGGLLFTSKIEYLRYINIFIYAGSALMLYKTFRLLKLRNWALIPVVIFSFHEYFLYISAMISPYNLVILFTLISMFFSIKILVIDSRPSVGDFGAFISATILAFYSDYTFFAMAPFYLCLAFFAVFTRKIYIYRVLILFLFVLIGILPGLRQISDNINLIKQINPIINTSASPIDELFRFCNLLTIHYGHSLPLYILGTYFALFFGSILILSKHEPINKLHALKNNLLLLSIILFTTFILTVISFLYIHNFIHSIIASRAMWFFYIYLIFIFSITIIVYFKSKRGINIFIALSYSAMTIHTLFISPGGIAHIIQYTPLLSEYVKLVSQKPDDSLYIFDNASYRLFPINNYYLTESYIRSQSVDNKYWRNLKKNRPQIYSVRMDNTVIAVPISKNYSAIFVSYQQMVAQSKEFLNRAHAIYYLKRFNTVSLLFIRVK